MAEALDFTSPVASFCFVVTIDNEDFKCRFVSGLDSNTDIEYRDGMGIYKLPPGDEQSSCKGIVFIVLI